MFWFILLLKMSCFVIYMSLHSIIRKCIWFSIHLFLNVFAFTESSYVYKLHVHLWVSLQSFICVYFLMSYLRI